MSGRGVEAMESVAALWENAADVLLDVLTDEDNDLSDESREQLMDLRNAAQEHAAVIGRVADRIASIGTDAPREVARDMSQPQVFDPPARNAAERHDVIE